MILRVPGSLAAFGLALILFATANASQRRSDVNPDPTSGTQGIGTDPTPADSTGRMWYYDTIDGLLISPVTPRPFFIKTVLDASGLMGYLANAATGDTATASAFGAMSSDSTVLLNFSWRMRPASGAVNDTIQVFMNAAAATGPVLATQLSAGGAETGRSPHLAIFAGPGAVWTVCLKTKSAGAVKSDYPTVDLGLYNFIRVGP